MTARELINFLGIIEKLKTTPRHNVMRSGRVESVAEHSWRLAVMAMLAAGEEQGLDRDRLIKLALVHDFGEAITGDIPAFIKTDENRKTEREAIAELCEGLPDKECGELKSLFSELDAMETPEARFMKALDKCEALLSHNEADISTWLPLEYELQLTYGQKESSYFPFTRELRRELEEDSRRKIAEEGEKQ